MALQRQKTVQAGSSYGGLASSGGHDYAVWCETLVQGMRDFTGVKSLRR